MSLSSQTRIKISEKQRVAFIGKIKFKLTVLIELKMYPC